MRFLITCAFIFVSIFGINAQLTVSGSFEKDSVLIGDPVTYTLSIKTTPGIHIISISESALDSIISGVQTEKLAQADTTKVPDPVVSDYEITSLGRWKDSDNNGLFDSSELSFDTTKAGTELLLENTFELVFWDPGPQGLRHPQLNFQFADSMYQYPYSGVSQVFVAPPFDLADLESDSIEVAGLKPIITEGKNITDYYFLFVILAAILGLALIWYLIIKTRSNNNDDAVKQPEVIKPAHVIALDKLQHLEKEELWQKGEIKEYQSKLTFAIREYLENRYDILALESTTDEIVRELKQHDFATDDEMALKEILQVADLVKFAKAKPDESVHDRFLHKAVDLVEKTKVQLTEEQKLQLEQNEKLAGNISNKTIRESNIETRGDIMNVEPQQVKALNLQTEGLTETKELPVSDKSSKQIFVQGENSDVLDLGILDSNSESVVLAKPAMRLLAFLVDSFILNVVMGTLAVIMYYFIDIDKMGEGAKSSTSTLILFLILMFTFFSIPMIYFVVGESKYGKTLGKKLFKIKVVNLNNALIGKRRALGRNLLKGVCSLFLYLPFLSVFFTNRKQGIHDKICKTLVIEDVKN